MRRGDVKNAAATAAANDVNTPVSRSRCHAAHAHHRGRKAKRNYHVNSFERADVCAVYWRVPLGSESRNYEIRNTRFRDRSETPLCLQVVGVVRTAADQPNSTINYCKYHTFQHLIISNAYVIAYSHVKCCFPLVTRYSKIVALSMFASV